MVGVRRAAAVLLAGALAGGCGGGGTEPRDPTPAAARLFDAASGRELTPAPRLTVGQPVRVEVRFYAANGGRIVGLEARHYAALAVDGSAVLSAAPVAGQRFEFDVAPSAPGTASLSVGYGDDAGATAATFGPFVTLVQ